MLYIDSNEPEYYDEIIQMSTQNKWEITMTEEMEYLIHNQTWDLVYLPKSKKALTNK